MECNKNNSKIQLEENMIDIPIICNTLINQKLMPHYQHFLVHRKALKPETFKGDLQCNIRCTVKNERGSIQQVVLTKTGYLFF